MAAKIVLYHKDDDVYVTMTVMILMCQSGGRVNWAIHAAMDSKLWLHYIRRHSCTRKGNSKVILEAGCVDVKWVWLVRIALLMAAMTR